MGYDFLKIARVVENWFYWGGGKQLEQQKVSWQGGAEEGESVHSKPRHSSSLEGCSGMESAQRSRSAAARDGRAPCAPPFGEMWGGAETARCVPGRPVGCIALLGDWPPI